MIRKYQNMATSHVLTSNKNKVNNNNNVQYVNKYQHMATGHSIFKKYCEHMATGHVFTLPNSVNIWQHVAEYPCTIMLLSLQLTVNQFILAQWAQI